MSRSSRWTVARTRPIPLLALIASGAVSAASENCRAIVVDVDRLACYDIVVDVDRLACYDKEMRPNAPPAQGSSTAADAIGAAPGHSALEAAWGAPGEATERFTMRPYKPVYLLALNYSSGANARPASPTQPTSIEDGLKRVEVKYQLSFKTRIASGLFGDNGDVWAAYTQSSHWQLYSPAISRPFRETNYEPEGIFVWKLRTGLFGASLRHVGIGINHQSNGRSDPLSRSWNRVIAQAGVERDEWTATLRLWRRIEERDSSDDNPDIVDYMGRGELLLTRQAGEHQFAATLRPVTGPDRQGHGALQLDWSFPISGRLKGHVQYFVGHGASLIDYNHFARTVGVGISLVAWR